MGIRFYCPNGHKLNVKEFQAGKRGICPHCEVRFRIPQSSQIPTGAPRSVTAPLMGRAERLPAKQAGDWTPATVGSRDSFAAVIEQFEDAASSFEPQVGPTPAQAVTAAAPPDASWYVRPPSGGQFGPAQGDLFRDWIKQGRVGRDSLVWREGWPEWRSAEAVFPELSGNGLEAGPNSTGPNSTGPNSTGPNSTGPKGTGPKGVGPKGVGPNSVGPEPAVIPPPPGADSSELQSSVDGHPEAATNGSARSTAAQRRQQPLGALATVVFLSLAAAALLVVLVLVVQKS